MSDLQKIPGVGPNIAADLEAIGIHSVDDLRGKDPEALYAQDCLQKGFSEDKCQLYDFSAVPCILQRQTIPSQQKLKMVVLER